MSHWDKAPEDAMHYGVEDGLWHESFYKVEDGMLMDWVPGISEEWCKFSWGDTDLGLRIWNLEKRPA